MLYTTVTIIATALFLMSSHGVEGKMCPSGRIRVPPVTSSSETTHSILQLQSVFPSVICPELAWNSKYSCSLYIISTTTQLEVHTGCHDKVIMDLKAAKKQDSDLSNIKINIPLAWPSTGVIVVPSNQVVGATLCFGIDVDTTKGFDEFIGEHRRNFPDFASQGTPTAPTGATGLSCASGTFYPMFDNGQLLDGQLKPVGKQRLSNDFFQQQLTTSLGQQVKCFVKVVGGAAAANTTLKWMETGTRIEYGLQPASQCPTSDDGCQRYATGDGGVCCCDGEACNSYTMSEALNKVQLAPMGGQKTIATTASAISSTTEDTCGDNIVIIAVLGSISLVLLLICIALLVVIILLKRKKKAATSDSTEEKKSAPKIHNDPRFVSEMESAKTDD